jgi:hypothetical protein
METRFLGENVRPHRFTLLTINRRQEETGENGLSALRALAGTLRKADNGR